MVFTAKVIVPLDIGIEGGELDLGFERWGMLKASEKWTQVLN
ncbi:hypothetical protein Q4491_09650 [Photobacterium sp. 2_MG-2023]|nr:hypothetical protein [Photobacterium sp. 2_MG-2023]MDO6581608.1 hypothetical protein [Photobacterium sp. 2_MG-2023]